MYKSCACAAVLGAHKAAWALYMKWAIVKRRRPVFPFAPRGRNGRPAPREGLIKRRA